MWRSLLFVPVLNDRLFEGAAQRGSDAIVLDLEAAVPQDRKDDARAVLPAAVTHLKTAKAEIAVRINPLDAGGEDDMAAAMDAGADLIVLPHATIASVKQAGDLAGATPLIPIIETPRGVIDALGIAEAASTVVGLGLGVEDYSTAMGAPPTPDLLIPAAFHVIQAARAAQCEPLIIADTIADYANLSGFEAAALKSRALGASGSFAIHPGQVEILNRVFMPTDEELRQAEEIIIAAEEANRHGSAIATRNGTMIDEPIIARARSILRLGQRYAEPSSPSKQTQNAPKPRSSTTCLKD